MSVLSGLVVSILLDIRWLRVLLSQSLRHLCLSMSLSLVASLSLVVRRVLVLRLGCLRVLFLSLVVRSLYLSWVGSKVGGSLSLRLRLALSELWSHVC